MAPEERIASLAKASGMPARPRKAGVMALFYPGKQEKAFLLLILRNTYRGVHSNQVGFPGGQEEDGDSDLLQTAIRETQEEVGIAPDGIEIVRPLSKLYIPPSNFEVYPYMGLYDARKPFVKEEAEVAALLEVPLIEFLDDKRNITQKMTTSYASNIEVPAFKLGGYIVWGATAMMLSEIKDLLKQVL